MKRVLPSPYPTPSQTFRFRFMGKGWIGMRLDAKQKEGLKRQIVDSLNGAPEVRRIVLFGSFVTQDEFNDIGIAIFQDSEEPYLPLALKYRGLLRELNNHIPLDVLPIRPNPEQSPFLDEINRGETIYECQAK